MTLVSEVIEQLRKIDRANYTHFVRQREIKRRSGENYRTPSFKKIVEIYLRSEQIANALIKKYSSKADKTLAYSIMCKN